jgi:hypothetical protein
MTHSKLASLIAQREGFYVPGSQPARKLNPGDLRHAPHTSHAGEGPDDIGIEPSVEDGWADLERQLQLYADRGLTLQQAIYEFAPPSENDSSSYLAFVCNGLGCSPDTPVRVALLADPAWQPTLPPTSAPATSAGSSGLMPTMRSALHRLSSALSPHTAVASPALGVVSPSSSAASAPTSSSALRNEVPMSTPNPILVGAAPSLITALQALQTFINNLGTDPAQVAVKFPGALQVLLGSLEMEIPGLAASELGAVQAVANARIAALIAGLQKATGK